MPIFFTKQGLENKKKQIEAQESKIKQVQAEAAEAAGVSYDWHDNFGYEEAQVRAENEQKELARLKEELKNAIEVEIKEQAEVAAIGTTVEFTADGVKREITIGAYGESDPANNLVSYVSPLTGAIMGMKISENKIIKIGDKKTELEILKIFPPSYKYVKLVKD